MPETAPIIFARDELSLLIKALGEYVPIESEVTLYDALQARLKAIANGERAKVTRSSDGDPNAIRI